MTDICQPVRTTLLQSSSLPIALSLAFKMSAMAAALIAFNAIQANFLIAGYFFLSAISVVIFPTLGLPASICGRSRNQAHIFVVFLCFRARYYRRKWRISTNAKWTATAINKSDTWTESDRGIIFRPFCKDRLIKNILKGKVTKREDLSYCKYPGSL